MNRSSARRLASRTSFENTMLPIATDGRFGYDVARPANLEGRLPDRDRPEEVALSTPGAEAIGVEVGDRLQLVSERLEQVHRALGEVQTFAAGGGHIQRASSDVPRGTVGKREGQTGAPAEEAAGKPARSPVTVAARP